MTDEKRKELHAEFYNKERLSVSSMSDAELYAEIEELEVICAEAKPRLRAAADEQRERYAKLTKEEREQLISESGRGLTGSDALNSVKIRKDRMTKADKTIESLKALGLDDATVALMTAAIVSKKVDKVALDKIQNPEPTQLEQSMASEKERIAKIEAEEKAEEIKKKQTPEAVAELEQKKNDFLDSLF